MFNEGDGAPGSRDDTDAVVGSVWNVGLKCESVSKEMEFLESLGASRLLHEQLVADGNEVEYGIVQLGGLRILITPNPVYEADLPTVLRPGLTHIVFEVADLDLADRLARAAGATQLGEQLEVEAAFGSRSVRFYESPQGTIFELMKIHHDQLA